MTEERFIPKCNFQKCQFIAHIKDNENQVVLDINDIVDLLNEQQATINKQEEIIKSQDMEISRQYNLCLAMSGVLREEFGVYDVFDRSKDKRVK